MVTQNSIIFCSTQSLGKANLGLGVTGDYPYPFSEWNGACG